jgi:hypothetical protein
MVRTFSFDQKPESLAMSPDGRRLYVALIRYGRPYYSEVPVEGYLASFDLDRTVIDRYVRIPLIPRIVLALDDQRVAVNSSEKLATLDSASGTTFAIAELNDAYRLVITPDRKHIYAAGRSSDIRRVDIGESGELSAIETNWASCGFYCNLSMSPLGDFVINGDGDVFGIQSDRLQDLQARGSLRITRSHWLGSIAFDGIKQAFGLIQGESQNPLLYSHNLKSLERFGQPMPVTSSDSLVGFVTDHVVLLDRSQPTLG